MTAVKKHYADAGLTHTTKRYAGSKNAAKALTFEELTDLKNYMTRYAEEHAFVLPGRIPGYHRTDIMLLPSNETKAHVYEMFNAAKKDG